MIHVPRSPAPAIFSSAIRQKFEKEAIEFYTKTLEERRKSRFVFKLYKDKEVKEALVALFHSKCAFCEQRLGAADQPLDIEHFRPKNGAVDLDGKYSHDHYWWLAYEWFNIYLSCVECNKSKGPRFPVKGERAKVQASEAEIRSEDALLLDPCADHPEDHLIFDRKGNVASSTERGRATIEIFNLNRSSLVEKRKDHAMRLMEVWNSAFSHSVTKDLFEKTELPLRLQVLDMSGMLAPDQEFVALTRQCFQQWSVELTENRPWLAPILDEFVTLRTGISQPEPKGATAEPTHDPYGPSPALAREMDALWGRGKRPPQLSGALKKQISQTVKKFKEHEKAQATYSLAAPADHNKFFAQTRYIESVEIKNFKVIKHLKLNFSQTSDAGSWLLVLGENGSGKSTLIQAIAITLMGDKERSRLGLNDGTRLATYPRKPREVVNGFVKIKLTGAGEAIKMEFNSKSPRIITNAPEPKVLLLGYSATRLLPCKGTRLTKGSQFSKTDNLFNPSLALTNANAWLHKLKPQTRFFYVEESLKRLMMLKPGDHFLKTTDGRIQVKAFGGSTVYLEDLSAGYQSVVALSTDIMGVLLKLWDSVTVAEGIVLIDEIDAHLHPRWKMQIVERLRLTFPRVQFLVTSHEPLSLRGLNQQEVAVMIRSPRGRVSMIQEDLPNPKALRVDQLLTSEYFGLSSTLSPELEVEFNEYYALLATRSRSPKQETRLNELKDKLEGLKLMGDTPRERMMYEVIDEFLARKAKQREKPRKLDQKTRDTLLQMWEEVSV
ncbi:MAG TPA: AAA family ATPase [Pyrinomonadaceae bacterium]|nr:AAA family ATPase [Pyrinomonadaceae bacterium]